jgi:hypothetical protein
MRVQVQGFERAARSRLIPMFPSMNHDRSGHDVVAHTATSWRRLIRQVS